MKIIRKDFVEDDNCYYCTRKHTLTTKIAYIIDLGNGKETQCGPYCAIKNFDKIAVANVPDFTRSAIEYDSNTSNSKGSKSINIINNATNTKELEYLHLRCKYLDDFADSHNIKFPLLMNIYNKNQIEINDKDKERIKNIMNKLKNNKLGYKNLMACYQAKRILNMWIKQETNNIKSLTVAKDFYNSLKEYCCLTGDQVIGLNKWIVNMNNIPKINGKWFCKTKKHSTA
jgi:flagellar basal body rod protein FlgB